jgi:hypothetical protein
MPSLKVRKLKRGKRIHLTEREATNIYVDTSYCCAIVGGKNANGVNGLGRESTVLFEAMGHAGKTLKGRYEPSAT